MRWFLPLVLLVVACDRASEPCAIVSGEPILIKRFGPAYPGGLCVDSIKIFLDVCPDTTFSVGYDNCSKYAP